MSNSSKYQMTINFNILNHLGINLYSNVPAVLSEIVANSWDADATKVDIEMENGKITITDNGDGMDHADINDRYLMVGYKRRKGQENRKTARERNVMGRKGIGKLSLFSIANFIRVETIKGNAKNGFKMSVKTIEDLNIENEKLPYDEQKPYVPISLPEDELTLCKQGTRIILTGLKKKVTQIAAAALQKRLARRFSIIGTDDFDVKINGKSVTVMDREYFHKIQYLWHFGNKSEEYVELCKRRRIHKLESEKQRDGNIEIVGEEDSEDSRYSVKGWIGTVVEPKELKDKDGDNLNKIVIMVRGKLAQEDILEDFSESSIYTKYLIGEIHADFLDLDGKQDIATSNRQEIIKDDSRYEALQKWVGEELKNIRDRWDELRQDEAIKDVRKIPAIADWLDLLTKERKRAAYAMFGKINQLVMDNENDRTELYKQSVLIFEKLRYKGLLEELDRISAEDIPALTQVFGGLDEIEAYQYYEIVQERLMIIGKLHKHVKKNDREKVIQEYLYDHLWLLDPSWDRATETTFMEESVQNEFDKLEVGLSKEEKRGRIDIKYRKTSGKHVIVELKRPGVKINHYDLLKQVKKYKNALRKLLRSADRNEPIEVVCIVGESHEDWEDPEGLEQAKTTMAAENARLVFYNQLIEDAYESYRVYTKKNKEQGRIYNIVQSIEMELDDN